RQAIEFLYAGQGIGRPFVAPPELTAERLKTLREAFDATMQDADFIAEAKNSKLELAPEDGAHLATLILKIYATPKPIVDKVTSLIKSEPSALVGVREEGGRPWRSNDCTPSTVKNG